ncbi:hypothetical protein niasHT_015365 [Heterodera trifolii]|uniref:biotin synthase n=1 Tax=Heterodera trifolii TaxID=157864 RepID=A0ABD2KZT0_9BILA
MNEMPKNGNDGKWQLKEGNDRGKLRGVERGRGTDDHGTLDKSAKRSGGRTKNTRRDGDVAMFRRGLFHSLKRMGNETALGERHKEKEGRQAMREKDVRRGDRERGETDHHHNPSQVQISTLLSIKTGACPENCSYCPQSGYHKTGLKKEPLMEVEQVLEAAKRAKASGATRFCMGAAWRGPKDRDLDKVCEMVAKVKQLGGLETCATLGLLKNEGQAQRLKKAGLDFYNHNIDCSKDFYHKIITTRRFDDRISTIEKVRSAGIKVCCGGIIGMGENNEERVKMLVTLANFTPPPESVPINKLMPFPGTPLANAPAPDPFDFVRTIATARVLMPMAYIRLSAGREQMADELQAANLLTHKSPFN